LKFFLEIGLWVVALNNLVLLLIVARRSWRTQRVYVVMLALNFVLAAGLLATSNVENPFSFISIGAFVFMVLLPPVVDRMAKRAVMDERYGLAIRLAAVRELLQPGLEAREVRHALARLAKIRTGQADTVIADLDAALEEADAQQRTALQMQKLSVFLYARRWAEAVAWFEEHLPFEVVAFHPMLASGMIRAYGELGELEKMAQVAELLEDSPGAAQATGAESLAQARLVFLAFAGRCEVLERLLDVRSGFAQFVDRSMRLIWKGIACKMAGKKQRARQYLEKGLSRLKGETAKREVSRHLEDLDAFVPPNAVLAEERISGLVEKILERASVAAALPRMRGGSLFRLAPVTAIFIGINILVWVALELFAGGGGDLATLIDVGANLKSAVRAGQYYRLITSIFLHGHIVHLLLNMLVLAILGRLAEQMVGSIRFVTVFVLSGVAGSAASFFWGEAQLSVGSSGAIFGVLGAMVGVLWVGRGQWPERWRKSLITLLIIMGGLSMLPGLQMEVIDNWAHIGGLVGGAAVGVLTRLAQNKGERMRFVFQIMAALAACMVVAAGYRLVTTMGAPLERRVGRVQFGLPASWTLAHDEAGIPEMRNLLYRARILVSVESEMGRFKTKDKSVGRAMVLAMQVQKARAEVEQYGGKLDGEGPRFGADLPEGWVGETIYYQVEEVRIVHGVFVKAFGGSSDAKTVVVIHVMAEKKWIEKKGAKTLRTLLRSVKLRP
jgi:rhomboid protease GluP